MSTGDRKGQSTEIMDINNKFHFESWTGNKEAMRVSAEGEKSRVENLLLHEHTLEIDVNCNKFARLVCTPQNLEELVIGRLFTSGIISGTDDINRIFICGQGNIADVTLGSDVQLVNELETEKSCCSANHQFMQSTSEKRKEIPVRVEPEPEVVFRLAAFFKKDSALHSKTNGTHSAYLMTEDGSVTGFEDISRHNALDKAVGSMLMGEHNPAKCVLFTTGRVPVDMVEKAIASGIPVLVSKSVPTIEAVELAHTAGLCLIGKAWPDSYERY